MNRTGSSIPFIEQYGAGGGGGGGPFLFDDEKIMTLKTKSTMHGGGK